MKVFPTKIGNERVPGLYRPPDSVIIWGANLFNDLRVREVRYECPLRVDFLCSQQAPRADFDHGGLAGAWLRCNEYIEATLWLWPRTRLP